MQRRASALVTVLVAAVTVVALVGTPARAEPSPSSSAGSGALAVGPETVGTAGCSTAQQGVTGIAITPAGTALISGNQDGEADQYRITTLDASCTAVEEPWDLAPYDPQDLLFANGKFYVCDCGDPDQERATIAVVVVIPDEIGGEIYRYQLPDTTLGFGPMVLDGRGLPVFIASDTTTVAVYTTAQLGTDGDRTGVALTSAGTWSVPAGIDPLITGAATSPDGSRVVLRSAAAAYEFEVTGGDVATAILAGPPTVTPLPSDTGESITYSADGSQFLTAPFTTDGSLGPVLAYPPYRPPAVEVTPGPTELAAPPTTDEEVGPDLLTRARILAEPPYRYGVAGAVVLLLLIIIISSASRRRRRRREEEERRDRGRRDRGGWGDPPPPTPTSGWGQPPQAGFPPSSPGGWGQPPQPGPPSSPTGWIQPPQGGGWG